MQGFLEDYRWGKRAGWEKGLVVFCLAEIGSLSSYYSEGFKATTATPSARLMGVTRSSSLARRRFMVRYLKFRGNGSSE